MPLIEARVLSGAYAVAGQQAHAQSLRWLNRVVEIARQPPPWQKQYFVSPLHEEFRGLSLLVQQLTGNCLFSFALFELGAAEVRCALVAVACERYRRQQGQWPARLEDLVPHYLARVPDDPLDGRPLRYRRGPDGITVYSVSTDRKDDGGKLDRKGTGPWRPWGTDLGVQLWDPARRRQPPKQK